MFHTGLLVIATPIRQILKNVAPFLREARQVVDQTLYIRLEPGYQWPLKRTAFTLGEISQLRSLIPRIYGEAARECSHLDVRVLQGFLKNVELRETHLNNSVEVVLAQSGFHHVEDYVKENFAICPKIHFLPSTTLESDDDQPETSSNSASFKSVCLGGTFDRLHLGHKVLLSSAVARATEKLVVGVTDGDMIKNKLLWELIEPLEVRIDALKKCLRDMDPTLNYDVTPIYDPYGPTIQDPSLECLYVSDETIKGGHKVNEERAKKNFPAMALFNVSLLPNHNKLEKFMDDKISSSSQRIALLGRILREPSPNPNIPPSPFVIGLTGGICTGKTHITKTLETLGASCISADLLGHETYKPGTALNQKLVDTFGASVRAEDGSINRRALGAIIFADAKKREQLNGLVWPEIERLIRQKIEEAGRAGARIVVIEAALLFEGGWDRLTHMVWYSLISEKEAICRVTERDHCDHELALKKIRSQKPAKMFIEKAHIVLSSMWEKEVTQQQVRRAFEAIQKYVR
ncbi:bifunctional coenzyme A synthase [Galendromus occidentalis]|uniref:Bifunctional coenzyme A synthase n=1 Tax=Galendromus occidentalis TaxID=34638 RepID=A0AAJ6VYT7_9ACAR|nr:bifunctional coenzyme A synthase [Galendromus occidentalis]